MVFATRLALVRTGLRIQVLGYFAFANVVDLSRVELAGSPCKGGP